MHLKQVLLKFKMTVIAKHRLHIVLINMFGTLTLVSATLRSRYCLDPKRSYLPPPPSKTLKVLKVQQKVQTEPGRVEVFSTMEANLLLDSLGT